MPGPVPTLSRCAPTTTTLFGSPPRVSAITFSVGVEAGPPLDAQRAPSCRPGPCARCRRCPSTVDDLRGEHRHGDAGAGQVEPRAGRARPGRPVALVDVDDRARARRLRVRGTCPARRRCRAAAARSRPSACPAKSAASQPEVDVFAAGDGSTRSAAQTGAVMSPDGAVDHRAEVAAAERARDARDVVACRGVTSSTGGFQSPSAKRSYSKSWRLTFSPASAALQRDIVRRQLMALACPRAGCRRSARRAGSARAWWSRIPSTVTALRSFGRGVVPAAARGQRRRGADSQRDGRHRRHAQRTQRHTRTPSQRVAAAVPAALIAPSSNSHGRVKSRSGAPSTARRTFGRRGS